MQKIQIIVGSTRKARSADKVAEWVYQQAAQQAGVEVEIIDLRDWSLPFFDEGGPQAGFSDPIVERWIQKISEADAYIIIAPEYNHSFTGVLKNALDYGFKAWRNKPVAFVGYGGDVTGGARAVEQLRLVAIELQMAPIKLSLNIPAIWKQFDENGQLNELGLKEKVGPLLEQLLWWSRALQQARQSDLAVAA